MAPTETSQQKRTEELRKRRAQRSQQRINTVSNRIVNPVNPRPVIVRGNAFGTPIHRQASTHARRQFYITMDHAAGTELRLPPISLANPGWRMLSGLLVLLAAIGAFSMLNSPFFQVQMLDVHGLERISSVEVIDALNVENLSIIEINRNDLLTRLNQRFPELMDVQVSVSLPNNISISAAERQPVLAWQKGDQLTWVDREGIIFPARGEAGLLITIQSDEALPVEAAANPAIANNGAGGAAAGTAAAEANGAKPTTSEGASLQKLSPNLLGAALSLSQKLPPETALVYDQSNGLGWNDPNGCQVYIGSDLKNFDTKFATYQHIASVLVDQGLRPSMINVEQLNAPFYRLEH